ncbi:MAG: cyclopropane-fatty-acyl-phospholipid synthase family protein [Candidatus Pelagadaptatus aseana]|uniref:class I SAM-dependent methyltransferase n=1 Tax=Candidatus Pelagadaptatus aseana TaxID=3120508 RepID=UPI0039B2BC76
MDTEVCNNNLKANASNEFTQSSNIDAFFQKLFINYLEKLPQGRIHLFNYDGKEYTLGSSDGTDAVHMHVHHPQFFRRVLLNGGIGMGEAFVDGWWNTSDLTPLLQIFARNLNWLNRFENRFSWITRPYYWLQHWSNRNHHKQSKKNIGAHYDLGNTLYRHFLDDSMLYSSGLYLSDSDTLEQSQANKVAKILSELDLKDGDTLLEVGTGWGHLAIAAAKHCDCRVTTTTISEEQYQYVQDRIAKENLGDRITLLKKDYRDLPTHAQSAGHPSGYDKIVSIEMIEAVGKQYMDNYFKTLNTLLKPGGTLVLQSITMVDQRLNSYLKKPDFIQAHIFPGGFLPSINLLADHITKDTQMVIRNISDFGHSYAKTLDDWHRRMLANQSSLNDNGYDERFIRLWRFYFSYCEAGFLEKTISVIHLTATKSSN